MPKALNTNKFNILSALPALTVTAVFMAVLAAKGIFPFGAQTIDYYDMGQINAPLFYHVWDVLHGKASFFFNWYINEGQNIAMAVSNQWNLSPFILTFFFVPRDFLMRFLSVYIGLHLVGMTVSMQYFLYRVTGRTQWCFRALFSISYGLCGYTLTHYTSPTFLDSAVFLPLLMLALFRLLREGKYYAYIFMLALSLTVSYYLGAIDMIYLLITGGAYILFICEREVQADRAGKLAAATIAGMLLSAVVIIPVIFSLSKSSRISENYDSSFSGTVISILSAIGADQYYVKFWQLFAMEAAIVIILTGLWKYRKERKKTLFMFIFFFAPCALIPFESINLIWHLGSYFHYPIRCGYLIPFSLLACASYYAGRLWTEGEGVDKVRIRQHILSLCFAVIMTVAVLLLFFRHGIWQVETVFKLWLVFSAVLFCIYLVIFLVNRIPSEVFIWFMLSELIIGAAVGYGKPHIYDRFFSDPEQSGLFVEESLALKDALNIEPSRLYRIKNPDTSLNANYGIIMNRAAFCGWAQTLSRPFQKGAEKLGYSTHFMRILDAGGTAFTDALLGVTETVSLNPQDKLLTEVYALKASSGEYSLYDLKNTFPYINIIPDDDYSIGDMDISELHNHIYRELMAGAGEDTADDDCIASRLYRGEKKDGDRELELKISGKKLLYLRKGETEKITVNGDIIFVPTISEPENTAYPAWFNSNLICLGEFEDETVSIVCPLRSEIFELDIEKLGALSAVLNEEAEKSGALKELSAGGDYLSFSVVSEGAGNMAVLPVNPDEYSSITVNGREVKGKTVYSVLTGVPLESGENHVRISFLAKGTVAGAVVSAAVLIVLAVLYFLRIKKPGFMEKTDILSLGLVRVLWVLAVFFIYIVPIAAFMIHQVVKRL